MKTNIKRFLNSNGLFFSALFLVVIFLFRNAFKINFFADDYSFLKISRVSNIGDFLHFFSPFRDYSYKPLATETFYYLIRLIKYNVVVGHSIMFLFYFVGLIYLEKISYQLSKNRLLSRLFTFLYAISFVHVFQLYWFATFQEIALFTFLSVSFYYFLNRKIGISIFFFILAALCKETAVLFTPFVIMFEIIYQRNKISKKQISYFATFIILTGIFWLIYKYSLDRVTSLDNYKITPNIRLFINNAMWYGLWAIGFPNFMPDYFRSILSKPLPQFWGAIDIPYIKVYFYMLLSYWLLFISCLILFIVTHKQTLKKIGQMLIFSIFGFLIFLGPILFFRHKWMIRETLPLIFVSLFQAYFIQTLTKHGKIRRIIACVLLVLYIGFNIFGIKTHESSSLYQLENDLFIKSREYFSKNKNSISQYQLIYFRDNPGNLNDIYKNSQRLKSAYRDQDFIDHYFPDLNIKVIYGFDSKIIPEKALIIDSAVFFK